MLGRPAPVVAETMITVSATTSGLDCPAGSPVTSFAAGDRVLAIARSDDGDFLAVRDGYDYGRTVWLPTRSVALDAVGVDEMPVDGCLQPVVTRESSPERPPAPQPQPEPGPKPKPAPAPGPAPDTTAPTPLQWWADPSTIHCPSNVGPAFPGTTTIHLLASDNVGVASATVAWSGAASGSGSMTASSGEWRFSYTAPATSGAITFTVTARDAAGNASAPRSVPVTVTCLF